MSRQEAVTVIRLDTSTLPASAAVADKALGQIGKTGEASAGQIRAAMRSLPAQFTDVATQLAGGQSPLLILLQQGGQVKDQFGGIGAALRGIGSLLSPAVLGVAGLAALAGVLALASRDADKLRNALDLSSNAAGLTADRFDAVARSVSASSSATESGAKDIALTLAKEGAVSVRVLESMAIAAARVADASGRTGTEVAADFAKMGANVADWAAEHNKAWNFITAEQYSYIKRLELQGRTEEAQIFISKQITGQLEVQRSNLGYLASAWEGVAKMASGAWQAMLGWGKESTLGDQLSAAEKALAKTQSSVAGDRIYDADGRQVAGRAAAVASLKERIESIKELQRIEARGADASSARAQTEQARIAKLREAEKGGSKKSVYQPQFERVMNAQIIESQKLFESEDARAIEYLNNLTSQREKEAAKRLDQQSELLQSLVDASAKANIEIIADDQQRALAEIDLDRRLLQRRIEAVTESGEARAAAEALADQNAAMRRDSVGIKFAKDTALVTREETRDALAKSFQDTKNPLKAFGDALGNIVFQRVSTRLADALLTATLGPGPDGIGGGLLSGLFSAGAAALTGGVAPTFDAASGWTNVLGGRASGGPVQAGGAYLVGEGGPEVLQMGSQPGRIIPSGAQATAGGGGARPVQITLAPVINIDARTDQAQIAQLVGGAMAQTQRDMWAQLHARGLA